MKNGAKNIKAQSIATIQKDFRKKLIVPAVRKMNN